LPNVRAPVSATQKMASSLPPFVPGLITVTVAFAADVSEDPIWNTQNTLF